MIQTQEIITFRVSKFTNGYEGMCMSMKDKILDIGTKKGPVMSNGQSYIMPMMSCDVT